MAVLQQNPFETSFETMTTKVQKTAKQMQKVVGDTAVGVMGDIKSQVGVASEPTLLEQSGVKKVPQQQQQQIQQQQQQVLNQTRQNLEKINQEIMQAKQKRDKEYQDRLKAEAQKKQQKKVEEQKKEEAPVWKQMLKKGSHEAMKNVAG